MLGMEPVLPRNYASDVNSLAESEKRYYSVADVCAMLGITRKTLFFYDREDLLKPRKRTGPQKAKLYLSEDIERLKTILEYKKAGQDDEFYTETEPTEVGDYVIRVTTPETDAYDELITQVAASYTTANKVIHIVNSEGLNKEESRTRMRFSSI